MKETKEVVIGLLALTTELAKAFKDGVQVADVGVILAKLQDDQFMAKLKAAYEDVEKVQDEVKVAGAGEVLEIVAAALPEIKALLEAVKK